MEAAAGAETAWGVDSEYGPLLDVLLCPPDHFRWLPTSAISRATLASGIVFSHEDALRQHAELVSVYEDAGVRVHLLEPDPALPYQVFARDSSINVPDGAIVTQCAQWWRRGEYAAVIRFYQGAGIPIRDMVTAGSFEGGDLMIVEPGVAAIGTGEERTQEQSARQVAPGSRPTAGRCASSGFRPTSSTSTCSPACWTRSWRQSAWSRRRTAS